MQGACAICEREEILTRHHLIPRTRHPNKRNKREFDRRVVKVTVGICRPCHSQIHALLTEKELERKWNTVESLRAHPEIAKFAEWDSHQAPRLQAPVRPQPRSVALWLYWQRGAPVKFHGVVASLPFGLPTEGLLASLESVA